MAYKSYSYLILCLIYVRFNMNLVDGELNQRVVGISIDINRNLCNKNIIEYNRIYQCRNNRFHCFRRDY
jgi:hypothetical protein